MSKSQLFLIDAYALCYRAFYAVRDLENSKGQPTNAVFGFANILRKLIKDFNPEYMAVCFDVAKKTKRQEKYAAYKIQRPSMPEDLQSQIPLIRDLIAAYQIPMFEAEGYEADDVIATLAEKYKSDDLQIVIVSSDKDLYQLVEDRVRVYSAQKGKVLGSEDVIERFGVPPNRMLDYLSLAGDTSDNIPGISGVGAVTACSLIKQFDTFEEIFEGADTLKGTLKQKVLNGRESAFLSRELATLEKNIPLDCSLESMRFSGPDKLQLKSLYESFEFFRFANELDDEAGVVAEKQAVVVEAVESALGDVLKEAKVLSHLAINMSFVKQEKNFVFWVSSGEFSCQVLRDDVSQLKGVLEDEEILKIVYGLKDLRKELIQKNILVLGEAFDVLLAAYLLHAGQFSYDIKSLAWNYLEQDIEKDTLLSAKVLVDLAEGLREALKDKGALDLYQAMERPLSDVLFEMEQEGVCINEPLLEKLSGETEKQLDGMTQKIYELAGEEFNINSPKQMGAILFEKLGLPVGKKTKTGYSTNEEILTKLSTVHKLPALILEYRQVAKLRSTYIEALPKLVNEKTGRIHCSFNQTGAETGRLSSNHPNLQNIPIRSEMGREIRKSFVPSAKDRKLLSVDYSQIELRVLAHLANEPSLKMAFASGEDIHSYTAGLMFDVEPQDVTTDMRYGAKRINFGIIYGMSAYGLARDLGVGFKEAQSFIDRYFLRFPEIQTFMNQAVERAKDLGYAETLLGRRRYLPSIQSRNGAVRQFAERQAINTPVQGTAADLIKAAMVQVALELKKKNFQSRMVITVHDELVFDVLIHEIEPLVAVVKRTMEGVFRLDVPLVVDVKVGPNWVEMDKI